MLHVHKAIWFFKPGLLLPVTVSFMHNYSITGYNWLCDLKSTTNTAYECYH